MARKTEAIKRIDLGYGYWFTTDRLNIALYRTQENDQTSKKVKHAERDVLVGYYTSFDRMFDQIFELETRLCGAENLIELKNEFIEIKRMMAKLINQLDVSAKDFMNGL